MDPIQYKSLGFLLWGGFSCNNVLNDVSTQAELCLQSATLQHKSGWITKLLFALDVFVWWCLLNWSISLNKLVLSLNTAEKLDYKRSQGVILISEKCELLFADCIWSFWTLIMHKEGQYDMNLLLAAQHGFLFSFLSNLQISLTSYLCHQETSLLQMSSRDSIVGLQPLSPAAVHEGGLGLQRE